MEIVYKIVRFVRKYLQNIILRNKKLNVQRIAMNQVLLNYGIITLTA